VNDIILAFAGKPVSDNAEEFARRVMEVKANEKVDLVVLRKGKKVEVKGVELPAVPVRPEFPRPAPVPFPAVPFPELPQLKPVGVPDGFDSVSVSTNNETGFTLKAKKGAQTYVLTGAFDDEGDPRPTSIKISEGDTTVEVPKLKDLPKERQTEVNQLLKVLRRAGR
jgi:serine protease Do